MADFQSITLIFAVICVLKSYAISQYALDLAREWSPLIWLHSEEQFLPSSIDYFLPFVSVREENKRIVQVRPTSNKIIAGWPTTALHLETLEKLACPSCTGPIVFHGQSVAHGNVPVYTFVRDYEDVWNTIDIAYYVFYPYNRGKNICIGIQTRSDCVGDTSSFGNHVGDWERVEIRFEHLRPKELFLSVHSFGAHYLWNETVQSFVFFRRGDTRELEEGRKKKSPRITRKFGQRMSPTFPPFVQLAYGTHPVVYSSNGSHGFWAAPGKHTYLNFPLLEDITNAGIPWFTWENLVVIPWQDAPYEGSLHWLNYQGLWGNLKAGCEFQFISGECQLKNGPPGPLRPSAFPPPRTLRNRNPFRTIQYPIPNYVTAQNAYWFPFPTEPSTPYRWVPTTLPATRTI